VIITEFPLTREKDKGTKQEEEEKGDNNEPRSTAEEEIEEEEELGDSATAC
jgi:hypothetical protein